MIQQRLSDNKKRRIKSLVKIEVESVDQESKVTFARSDSRNLYIERKWFGRAPLTKLRVGIHYLRVCARSDLQLLDMDGWPFVTVRRGENTIVRTSNHPTVLTIISVYHTTSHNAPGLFYRLIGPPTGLISAMVIVKHWLSVCRIRWSNSTSAGLFNLNLLLFTYLVGVFSSPLQVARETSSPQYLVIENVGLVISPKSGSQLGYILTLKISIPGGASDRTGYDWIVAVLNYLKECSDSGVGLTFGTIEWLKGTIQVNVNGVIADIKKSQKVEVDKLAPVVQHVQDTTAGFGKG
ncbi:hypothetical protein EV359DRAFT_66701 [Lentinula novae-zelandiae]|nr:hypothetical protein EV359DRAFT_66701 [Lentinula novae-zelandiae]